MKRILMIVVALCFVFAGNIENFAQTRKKAQKPVRKKLVRCYENGKRVYRTKCKTSKPTNPELAVKPQTNNKKDEEQMPYGVLSSGAGTGGGIGNGNGRGYGTGTGSGSGNGSGNGNTPIPTVPQTQNSNSGQTAGVFLLSKPSPTYTDAARQNKVQGSVTLRVTFLANGTIGSISPVSALPYGLTEQAIAAARRITFRPAMKNGKPYSVTKVIRYNFTIY